MALPKGYRSKWWVHQLFASGIVALATRDALAREAATGPLDPPAAGSGASARADDDGLSVADRLGTQLMFDARQTSFSRDGLQQIFEGDVVAIGAGALMAADRIALDRRSGLLTAEGHLVLMSRSQVFLGDRVEYNTVTGDFHLDNAIMFVNDQKATADVVQHILGFTPKELAFESARKDRGRDIAARKELLREEVRRQSLDGREVHPDLVERYAVLLEEEELIKRQDNPSLAQLPQERREDIKRRRDFYEKSRASSLATAGSNILPTTYFRIAGDRLERHNGNDFTASDALWTPCRCEDDETPAWAFRTRRTDAQIGGYADLYDPVLEIKGIPILYLPYLKVPLKDQRQSGFLMPTFGFQRRSGNIYSQPVFFDLGADRDATLTTDVFERRGTRLSAEYRHQQREHSGWEMRLEGIRDRLWMADRGMREELRGLYRDGLASATAAVEAQGGRDGVEGPGIQGAGMSQGDLRRAMLSDPDYWDRVLKKNGSQEGLSAATARTLADDIERHAAVPANGWRGAYVWRGVSFLAPRLSLVSNAEIVSDHRYSEELAVPDDFREAFFGERDSPAISPARVQLHLDGSDFYAGLGLRYGDNFLADQRFEGEQAPLVAEFATRRFALTGPASLVPVTGRFSADLWRISDQRGKSTVLADEPSLGDGSWRRFKFDAIAPLLPDTLVQVSQFAEAESRFIEHFNLDERRSEMRSWRTGFDFVLPIDGKGELPEVFQTHEDCSKMRAVEEADACRQRLAADVGRRRYAHHLFDLRLRFSIRPTVVKNGPYTDPFAPGGDLAYFATDRFVNSDIDRDVSEEYRMKEHQRVTFSTTHVWKLFSRGWDRSKGAASSSPSQKAPMTSIERARLELVQSLERPSQEEGHGIFDPVRKHGDYRLRDAYYAEPVRFRAEVTYDALDAKRREDQKRANRELDEAAVQDPASAVALAKRKEALAEPWKDPLADLRLLYGGWRFDSTVRYSIYGRTARDLSFNLSLPQIMDTSLVVGYSVTKVIDLERGSFTRTRERRMTLASSLIPPVTSYVRLRSRVTDDVEATHAYGLASAVGFDYQSPTQCWGLQFAREKDYEKDERDASYIMRFSVVFMGQQRPLPNMSSGMTRRIREDAS